MQTQYEVISSFTLPKDLYNQDPFELKPGTVITLRFYPSEQPSHYYISGQQGRRKIVRNYETGKEEQSYTIITQYLREGFLA